MGVTVKGQAQPTIAQTTTGKTALRGKANAKSKAVRKGKNTVTPFSENVKEYSEAGFGVFPMPVMNDSTIPTGFTGRNGVDASEEQIKEWISSGEWVGQNSQGSRWVFEIGNLGLRLPIGVIALKANSESLASLESEFGVLPQTYKISTNGTDGFYLYRIPTKMKLTPSVGEVQVIHHCNGFVVAPGSVTADGVEYCLYDLDGEVSFYNATIQDFAELPESWIEELSKASGNCTYKSYKNPTDQKPSDAFGIEIPEDADLAKYIEVPSNTHSNEGIDPEVLAVCAALPETDLGLAERLLLLFGNDWLISLSASGNTETFYQHYTCLCDSGIEHGRWKSSLLPQVQDEIARVARIVPLEAESLWVQVFNAHYQEPESRDGWSKAQYQQDQKEEEEAKDEADCAVERRLKWAKSMESKGRLLAAAKLVRSAAKLNAPGMFIEPDKLDATANMINTHLGMVKTQTGERLPYQRESFFSTITRGSGADLPPTRELMLVVASLREIGPLIPELVQMFYGTGLVGSSPQAFMQQFGESGNGKSTLSLATYLALGDVGQGGYAAAIGIDVLADSRFGRDGEKASPSLNRTRNARFVYVDEAANKKPNENLLKSYTSGEVMLTRGNYQDASPWISKVTLVMSGNDRLNLSTNDPGIERRFIPIRHAIALEKLDITIKKNLCYTQAGIDSVLAWLIRGAKMWFDANQPLFHEIAPREVIEERNAYLSGGDAMDSFWEQYIVEMPDDADDVVSWGSIIGDVPSLQDLMDAYENKTGHRVSHDWLTGVLKHRGHAITERRRWKKGESARRGIPTIRIK